MKPLFWNSQKDFPENFINEAKQIIENGFENSSKSTDIIQRVIKSTDCFTCIAYSTDPNDTTIKDCYSGQGWAQWTDKKLQIDMIFSWTPQGNGEWKTCDDGQVCLTYFYFNNMVPNGIDMTYQAMTSCRKWYKSWDVCRIQYTIIDYKL